MAQVTSPPGDTDGTGDTVVAQVTLMAQVTSPPGDTDGTGDTVVAQVTLMAQVTSPPGDTVTAQVTLMAQVTSAPQVALVAQVTPPPGDGRVPAGDPDDVAHLGPFHFPCYRWLQGYGTWELPEGTATTPAMERHPRLQRQRRRHLVQQRRRYRLAPFAPGLPWALPLGTPLDPDLSYSWAKASAFYLRGSAANLEAKLRGFLAMPCSWPSVEAMTRVFRCFHTPVTEYVVRHWQSDAFFGEQFLSGVNPVLLRRCPRLPPNFPVTEAMVAPSLGTGTSLQREMEAGNIYLADYGVLQGLPTATIDGRPTFVAAPLCLLHQRPDGEMLPLAIQLSQEPGPESPLFVPQDPPWLWALAKAWVRSSEFQVHEALTHLLRAHLLGEVFALATLRQLPPQHPLFKLLVPHTRFTVQIGALARRFLLNPGGVFDRAVALGRRGLLALVARGLRALRWRSLVLPRDLRHRGVAATKRHHFGSDATKVWRAIRRFVTGVLSLYYLSVPRFVTGVLSLYYLSVPRFVTGVPNVPIDVPRFVTGVPIVPRFVTGVLSLYYLSVPRFVTGVPIAVPRFVTGVLSLYYLSVPNVPRFVTGVLSLYYLSVPIVPRFVTGVLSLYYPSDAAVQEDPELQAWVGEIFTRGFLGRRSSGVPSRLHSVRGLVTFVTTVIYTCSAHHAATNSGQFELSAFPPNAPAAMRAPPPRSKAALSEREFLEALPAMNTTATVLAVLWVLRNEPMDLRPLGHYPERHFTEAAPRRLIRRFRRRLRRISREIRARNAGLERPYPYLDPENIENSVAI
ncbi:polyunsaturated fatty acid lipoxygenase ALOX15B isoform X3 [Agelaius tricolor]|uniref:polyunsaturated fatty acid lipoxygenase ALOX15B isoform X3 n=1 Tax=Agelaius tricolor TaxID=9191 RepID=UPI0039F16F93